MDKRFPILNRENEVELFDGNKRGIYNEEEKTILYDDGTKEVLKTSEAYHLAFYKQKTRKELVTYYNALLSGKEKIMLLKDGKEYILTSPTLMDRGSETPKYAQAFESIFLPNSLKRIGIEKKIEGLAEVNKKVSEQNWGEEKVIHITLFNLMNKIA